MSYTATGYYLDPNGRRGNFQVESPSSDRRQIERIVRGIYDADKVIINGVGPASDPMAEQRERARREQERFEREMAERRVEQPSYSSSSSSYSSSSSSYRQPSYSGGGSNIGCGGFIGLALLLIIAGIFGAGEEDTAPAPEPAPAATERAVEAPVTYTPPTAYEVYEDRSRTAPRPVQPPVTPVWEMEEDLTGNPDFMFND